MPNLADYMREVLTSRYGSVMRAADQLDIPYERLKKALQRNKFSSGDIAILLPGMSLEELRNNYTFELARRYVGGDKSTALTDSQLSYGLGFYKGIADAFRTHQKGARDIHFSQFVNDIYALMSKAQDGVKFAMTLFCHANSMPIEWEPENSELLQKLADAFEAGGNILYIMEIDLSNEIIPRSINEDDADRRFQSFVRKLKLLKRNPKGHVVLIRVRRCVFCSPLQKPALFSVEDDSETKFTAVTTLVLPESIDGRGNLGIIALPQTEPMAYAMRDFILELIFHLSDPDLASSDVRFVSAPPLSNDELATLLRGMTGVQSA